MRLHATRVSQHFVKFYKPRVNLQSCAKIRTFLLTVPMFYEATFFLITSFPAWNANAF